MKKFFIRISYSLYTLAVPKEQANTGTTWTAYLKTVSRLPGGAKDFVVGYTYQD